MHCIMGKDEYNKSQGEYLSPISPEHTGESQSVSQGIAANHVSCSTQSDCKISQPLVLTTGLPSEPPLKSSCDDKQPASNGSSCYRTTKLLDSELPKSCPSDFFQNLNDKPERSVQSELASIGPEDSSDSEELGLKTHRPNMNANSAPDLVTIHNMRPGQRQGRKERAVFSWKKGDNSMKVREDDQRKYHHTATNNSTSRKGNGRQRLDNNKYNPMQSSPPQKHQNNFVNVHGEYDIEEVGVAYHPHQLRNYKQYVVPPNFAYTADDIYRNAFSVGSYPHPMAHKKMVPEMLTFVNALVSPTFFAPSYHHHHHHHQQQQQELTPCQYYTTVNQDVSMSHRQSAQQTPRGEAYASNTVQPQTPLGLTNFSSASPYVDRLHPMDTISSGGGGGGADHSDQNTQPHGHGTNTSQVIGHDNWLQNGGEEACSSNSVTGSSGGNGKPIFRSRSFSTVEQSSREAELSAVHADNYMSPHHSSYSIGDVENDLHHLNLHHSKSDTQYLYQNVSGPQNSCANVQICPPEDLVTNNGAHPNDCRSCDENLPPGRWQHEPKDNKCSAAAQYSRASEKRPFRTRRSEFYEDDGCFVADAVDDNVFCQQSRAEVNFHSSSSYPGWTLPVMNHKSAFYHHDGKSQSFSQAENYLSFGGNKLESYSDTEIYLKSPQSGSFHHKFQMSSDYEDVGHQDFQSTMQAVFAMDEDIFNSPETGFHYPVPPLNLADSSEFDNRQFECLTDRDRQEQFQTCQVHEDGYARHQGTRYHGTKGPRKVQRKSGGGGGGGATDIYRSLQVTNNGHCNNNVDLRSANSVPVYKRHWENSSIILASSYNCRDLNTFSSVACQQLNKNKGKDADVKHQGNSPSNLQRKEQRKNGPSCNGGQLKNKRKNYPKKSSRPMTAPRCLKREDQEKSSCCGSVDKEPSLLSDINLGTTQELTALQPESESQDVFESEMIKWHNGSVYPWNHLPDEIWLNIFSFLSNHNRFQCSLVSKQFYRILQDESLWRHITLEKKMLQDDWLMRIAHLHPSILELIQCHGDQVTAAGLNYLFNECTDSLLKLRFSRCSRGELTGDNILLASTVCRNLTHVDASWCTVTDSGLSAIAKSCDRLESLCLNGCGLIADNGLKTLATLHCKSLKELEMFGCFNITPRGIRYLASICRNLRTLQLGQCYKITDSCIAEVSSSLCCVENLDLRGCKQIRDTCIEKIVDHCSRLQTLALANCPNIGNNAMQKIASTLPGIRSIDVCGCKLITDESVNRLAMNCRQLVYLDISSTGCTYKSVCRLAEQGSTDLETLKLNFIAGITEHSLTRLTNHCKRLTTLHLYGCKRVRNLKKLQALHPQLIIESDKY